MAWITIGVGVISYELRIWLLTKAAMTLADVMEGNVRSFGVYALQSVYSSEEYVRPQCGRVGS